jgi:hypothetical protein
MMCRAMAELPVPRSRPPAVLGERSLWRQFWVGAVLGFLVGALIQLVMLVR